MKALTEETGVKADEPAAAEGEMMMEAEMMEGGDDMMEGDGMALPEACLRNQTRKNVPAEIRYKK